MFAEISTFISSLNLYIHVTPNWFQFLLSLQKNPISIDEVLIRFKLICQQAIAFVENLPFLHKNRVDINPAISKKVEMPIDDPMVHSGNIFEDALVLQEAGDYEKALSAFEQYREYHPEDPRAYYEIASCHCYLQNFDLGLKLIERALLMNKEYGEALGLRGLILIKKYDYANAIPNLHHANVLLPDDEAIKYGLVVAYFQVGLYASAMILVKQLLAIRPSNPSYLVYEACLCEKLFQLDRAIALMESVIADNPGEIQNISILNEIKERNVATAWCSYVGMNN